MPRIEMGLVILEALLAGAAVLGLGDLLLDRRLQVDVHGGESSRLVNMGLLFGVPGRRKRLRRHRVVLKFRPGASA